MEYITYHIIMYSMYYYSPSTSTYHCRSSSLTRGYALQEKVVANQTTHILAVAYRHSNTGLTK